MPDSNDTEFALNHDGASGSTEDGSGAGVEMVEESKDTVDTAEEETEGLAQFASRHRLPVNVVREANKDNVDELGNVTGKLRLPDD